MSEGFQYLVIKDLNKRFGSFRALKNISLEINEGEFVCFLGPSGCGKTTLLRCIAGLEIQSSGDITQNNTLISDLPTSQRDFGIVFQSYALFPNLSCFENIAYGLKNLGWSRANITNRTEELLELIGLSDHTDKYPSQLSGGEQQRIALARAIATSPNLLLLDEPLSALDAKVRVHLRQELKEFHRRLGLTTVMVTHDQEEALTIADRIFVMDKGEIMQFGTPMEIYSKPINPFVANFIGMSNFIEGTVEDSNNVQIAERSLQIDCAGFSKGEKVKLAVRPECIQLTANKAKTNIFSGKVVDIEFLGSFLRFYIETSVMPNSPLVVDKPISEDLDKHPKLNELVNFFISSKFLNIFKHDSY